MIRNSSSASVRHLAGHRRPAQHRRHRARGAADDDVLRRERLEDHGIDDGIADERGQRQPHRERVHVVHQQPQAEAADQAGKHHRLERGQLPARQRPPIGAPHAGVDLLLDQAIDRRRRARHQRDAGRGREQDLQRHHAGRREQHADDRGEHDQRHHARLGQREERARPVEPGAGGGFAKEFQCSRWLNFISRRSWTPAAGAAGP